MACMFLNIIGNNRNNFTAITAWIAPRTARGPLTSPGKRRRSGEGIHHALAWHDEQARTDVQGLWQLR